MFNTKTFFDKYYHRSPHLTERIYELDVRPVSKKILNSLASLLDISAKKTYGRRRFLIPTYKIRPFLRYALVTYHGGLSFGNPTTMYGVDLFHDGNKKAHVNLRHGRWEPLIDIAYFKIHRITVESKDDSFLKNLGKHFSTSDLKIILKENKINLDYRLVNKFWYE